MSFPKTKQIRSERRIKAEQRNAEYSKLSVIEKLQRLPGSPTAKKQRAKLVALLSK